MDITPQPVTPPPAPSRGVRLAKAGALVAAGALAATALTGIAFGAGSPSPAPASPGSGDGYGFGAGGMGPGGMGPGMRGGHGGMVDGPDGDEAGGWRGMGPMGMRGPGIARGDLLHGEGVAKKDDGTFVTVRTQNGTVVSASASQVVIRSEDGVTWTWPITSTTAVRRDGAVVKADAIEAGDVARALGTVKDGAVTTVHVGALSPAKAAELKARRDAWLQAHPNAATRGGRATSPAPSPGS